MPLGQIIESEDIIQEDITINEPIKIDDEFYNKLDSVLDSYFTTLEEQEKKEKEEKKKEEEEKKKQEEEKKKEEELIQQFNSDSSDFQTQLINEIKVLQDNQYVIQNYLQYQNNLTFFGILMALLIFVSTLIYKFFKNFI